jgi:glycosyltransferase involved in cell wall biosynthesis
MRNAEASVCRAEMRILFVTTNKHLPEHRGGMEVNTHELNMALLERGASVGVLCGLAGVGLIGVSARLRRKFLRDPYPMDIRLGYPTWRSYDSISYVGSVAAAFKPDVFVVQGGADFISLVTSCLRLGPPVVCYLHSPDRLVLPAEILRNPSIWFIANSSFTRSIHTEKDFLGVVPPIVPPGNYSTVTNRGSCAVFINPAPYKGLDIVLSLAEARPDVTFLFVVNRRRFRHNDATQQPWDRLQNVKTVGPIRDMRKIYRRAKLVLAPSQWVETWGRIATEAHFSGIPVLASDSGGLPEAVGPGGLCLPRNAPVSEWLQAFSGIWDDPVRHEELSKAASQYSRRREISRDAIVESFLALLNAACAKEHGRQQSGHAIRLPLEFTL